MKSHGYSPPRVRKGSWRWWLASSLLSLLVLAVLVPPACLMFGHVSGEELCPHTFRRRSFSYFELPILGWLVGPITRRDVAHELQSHLAAEGYVPSTQTPHLAWHLVASRRAGVLSFRGDADILCRYLDALDETGNLHWERWTDAHPDLARTFWPTVAQTASHRLYLLLPALFDLASRATEPQVLEQEMYAELARSYRHLAQVQQQLGQYEAALELLSQSLLYSSEDEEYGRQHADLLRLLGRG